VIGPDGLSRFEELSRREAAQTAILYAFDLIEHDGEDLRGLPFLDRKAALARLLCNTKAAILLNEHTTEYGASVFAHACRLGQRASFRRRDEGPQSRQHRRAAERSEIWNGRPRQSPAMTR
jgi:bifunctional non-homologous end joining protein LigD